GAVGVRGGERTAAGGERGGLSGGGSRAPRDVDCRGRERIDAGGDRWGVSGGAAPAPPDVDLTQGKIEKSTAFSVMNSSSAGVPSRVFAIARLMAGTMAPGSVTRSPQPPSARAKSA